MGVAFYRSELSVRYLEKRSRSDLIQRYFEVHKLLGTAPPAMPEFKDKTCTVMARELMGLYSQLPPPPSELKVSPRVDRTSGGFYIPIDRKYPAEGAEVTVCRVSSDAFDGDEARAKEFARALVESFNMVNDGSTIAT